MSASISFTAVGRLPLPGDNVAIATRRIDAGTRVACDDGSEFTISHTVMVGHRFAVQAFEPGQPLLSWELPFGYATRAIRPGDYVCNPHVLELLNQRRIDFELPEEANFEDRIVPYELDPATFQPGQQVPLRDDPPTFRGYDRGRRGVGTRNTIIVLATTSRTAAFAHRLAERLSDAAVGCENIDGIVPVTHTEGGGQDAPNNIELLLRTLAGFMVHPNVGAVLAVDYGTEPVNNRILQGYLARENYPVDDVPHEFCSIAGDFESQLSRCEGMVRGWIDLVNGARRTDQPMSGLKIALECGGSDAFSGISGNPLAAWAAREMIRCGGSAVLAETDELTGAESYVLQNVKDFETAQRFLHVMAQFEERVSWHGTTAEGNVSGGNKFRGLYNIVVKSIGAAAKKSPDVRIDDVIEYSRRLSDPGFYFMDTPGNDLESIAGMVAGGCNLIYFITGNGSITNFPFVPTIKLMTTTERYELLNGDMDVNAGAYLDGVPMDTLGQQLFERSLDAAGGARTRGELAGHSQVSIWRHWPQSDSSRLDELLAAPPPSGQPLEIQPATEIPERTFSAIRTEHGPVSGRVGIVMPTSLCSGQIGRLCASRMNANGVGGEQGFARFSALAHTEGCGSSAWEHENIVGHLTVGYAMHPLAGAVLMLEHGCEKTHNDYMHGRLRDEGVDPDLFGWASVQLDGGIENVISRVESWFTEATERIGPPVLEEVGIGALKVGLITAGTVAPGQAAALALLTSWIVSAGGTIVMPDNDSLADSPDYVKPLVGSDRLETCLGFGYRAKTAGFYAMATPTEDATEVISGLGATGMELILAVIGDHPVQGHPLVPVLQVSSDADVAERYSDDMDLALGGAEDTWALELLDLLVRTAGREYTARATAIGNTAFQVTRGLLGVSS